MVSLKSIVTTGAILGLSIVLAGCSTPSTPTVPDSSIPATTATTVDSKPIAKDGVPISEISYSDVKISDEYLAESATDLTVAQDAAKLGLDTLKVFTADYAKYQKKSEGLNQKELLALLPDAESKLTGKLSPDTLRAFSDQWKENASDPAALRNTSFMLVTDSEGENPKENTWENSANLECGLADAEWTTTFSSPGLEFTPTEGADYKVTAFKATAHYLVPCSGGKVLSQNMDWTFELGASADNSKWEIYRWERKPVGDPVYAG